MSEVAAAISAWVDAEVSVRRAPAMLFMSGAQGIGKSTALAALTADRDRRIAVIGLDDVYLTADARARLAHEVHPLFVTRGPPGTHDLPLLDETLEALASAGPTTRTPLPRFDKRCDDRAPRSVWPVFEGAPDVVIVEGWMMGAAPDPDAPKSAPLNAVEAEDPDGVWRARQEAALAGPYAALWDRADAFLHLDAPSFAAVRAWRIEQEETTLGLVKGTLPADRSAWVARFIQHYERVTRRMLNGCRRPGAAIKVDETRRIVATSALGA